MAGDSMVFLWLLLVVGAKLTYTSKICGPSFKQSESGKDCVQLTNEDVLQSLHWLAHPPKVPEEQNCKNMTIIAGVAVCEDLLPPDGDCLIWSSLSSVRCNEYGDMKFEKYWATRCKVEIFHYVLPFKGNSCEYVAKVDPALDKKKRRGRGEGEGIAKIPEFPNITIRRIGLWSTKKYSGLYEDIGKLPLEKKVDVLKIQRRENIKQDDLDGVQFTILSDLYLHKPHFAEDIHQIAFSASINTNTMSDNVGREAENAWNMWGTRQFLSEFASMSTEQEVNPALVPLQYSYMLDQARVDSSVSAYHHTFVRVKERRHLQEIKDTLAHWKPATPEKPIFGKVPDYCHVPTHAAELEMRAWIRIEMNARCHPTRLWVPCERSRTYDPFTPCPQELANNLAEDYAVTKNWCDFTQPAAQIPQLRKIDSRASLHFQKPPLGGLKRGGGGTKVRIAFFFTVYADEAFFRRMFAKLYSPEHYYLVHIDPAGASKAYHQSIQDMADEYNVKAAASAGGKANVFITSDVPIVYSASTATILLTKAMSWFVREAKGWDYFVPVTGSDYPLVPLNMIEKMLGHQGDKPRPFVMAWTPGTSTHIFRLQKTVPAFETDPALVLSIKAVTDERGRVLGAVPMEYRSTNFGPPLFCSNMKSFYHLDNRRNKSGTILDTQWLFPRDIQPGRGRAYSDYDPAMASPSFDNGWRIWKKSDPATTGVYDLATVEYITESEEGRKYYHFFKHMLLGSEEHYYVSLLYNWPRTQAFVQTLSAQTVWNTWELGLWEQSAGFLTHTHFLTLNEWPHIMGFSKRGMIFARKFNTHKTTPLLDKIDAYIHNNASTDAGSMWPGFFEVDTWSPGKKWVAEYRFNQTKAHRARMEEKRRMSNNK